MAAFRGVHNSVLCVITYLLFLEYTNPTEVVSLLLYIY